MYQATKEQSKILKISNIKKYVFENLIIMLGFHKKMIF